VTKFLLVARQVIAAVFTVFLIAIRVEVGMTQTRMTRLVIVPVLSVVRQMAVADHAVVVVRGRAVVLSLLSTIFHSILPFPVLSGTPKETVLGQMKIGCRVLNQGGG